MDLKSFEGLAERYRDVIWRAVILGRKTMQSARAGLAEDRAGSAEVRLNCLVSQKRTFRGFDQDARWLLDSARCRGCGTETLAAPACTGRAPYRDTRVSHAPPRPYTFVGKASGGRKFPTNVGAPSLAAPKTAVRARDRRTSSWLGVMSRKTGSTLRITGRGSLDEP